MHSVTHVPPPNTVHRIVFSNSIKISSSMNLFRLTDRSVRFTQSIKPKNSTGSKRSSREARVPLQVSWPVPSTAGLPKVYGETMAMFRWSSMKSKKEYCTNPWHFRWTCIKNPLKHEEPEIVWLPTVRRADHCGWCERLQTEENFTALLWVKLRVN